MNYGGLLSSIFCIFNFIKQKKLIKMANFKSFRKKKSIATLTGVEVGIMSATGMEQEVLTTSDNIENALPQFLLNCIEYLGDKKQTDLKLEDIRQLLPADINKILWDIRKISVSKNFVSIKYEFPLHNNKRPIVDAEVDLDQYDKSFKVASWVKEGGENKLIDGLPVIYNSYSEMLKANQFHKLKLPDCGVDVRFEIATQSRIDHISSFTKKKGSNFQISVHSPVYFEKVKNSENEKPITLPLLDLGTEDIEALRQKIRDVNPDADTTFVIQHPFDSGNVQQLNLVSMPAFYFPSLGV